MHDVHAEMADLVSQFMRERKGEALGTIFERYSLRMRRLARKALRSKRIPDRECEADDLLDSALDALLRLVLKGRVESIRGVDGFWRLYRRILAYKVSAACDRQFALKRGGPGIRKPTGADSTSGHASVPMEPVHVTALPPDDFDLFESNLPTADLLAIGREMTQGLLDLLDPEHQRIAHAPRRVHDPLDGGRVGLVPTHRKSTARDDPEHLGIIGPARRIADFRIPSRPKVADLRDLSLFQARRTEKKDGCRGTVHRLFPKSYR